VHQAVRTLRARWQRTLPVVVDSTRWTVRGTQISVDGGVLTKRQADDYVAALLPLVESGSVPRPPLLSDPSSPWTAHQWVRVAGDEPIDLLQSPEGELQNQWRPPAWLRLFVTTGSHSLVQLPDGTLGWLASERIDKPAAAPTDDPWRTIRRAQAERALALSGIKGSPNDALQHAARIARSRLNRPYLWGGNLPEASDCSGFVQSVLWECTGILLPKNTRDQRRHGEQIAQDWIAAGDLIFVRGKKLGLHHVGLVLESSQDGPEQTVIHASMSRNAVLEEELSVFIERHDYIDTRRIVQWQDSEARPEPTSSGEAS